VTDDPTGDGLDDGALQWTVPEALAGQRVDRAVAMATGWSRAEVQAVAADGGILVDGRPAAKSQKLTAGQAVRVAHRPEAAAPPGPEPVPVDVRHRDDDLFVIAKPAGLVVHPGAGHHHGTLVHGLLALDPAIASVGDPERPGIVHRLDRDTSGLMVVARTPAAHEGLVAALARRDVERDYLALVWGHPENARGVIDAPIGRSTTRRTRMAVRREGKDARTVYEVREWFVHPEVALLDCRLETGRTHQIRVHLAAIGHPVVGDGTYGGNRTGIRLDRPFLHAAGLRFRHPVTGVALAFEEPLPADLATVLAELRETSAP
jgi:23S rRNA pseudouridine1911/1915/1917 synthase